VESRYPELLVQASLWHAAEQRPFYTVEEVRTAMGVGGNLHAPILRMLGWTSKCTRWYGGSDKVLWRTLWIPPGGLVARRRGRPPKVLTAP
jgi:hypothetical protein